METNKHENKRRIKELERAAQAQSSTDNRPLKIVWTCIEPGSPKDPNDDSKPGDWLIEFGDGDEIIKRRRGTDEEEEKRKADRWKESIRRNQGENG